MIFTPNEKKKKELVQNFVTKDDVQKFFDISQFFTETSLWKGFYPSLR